MNEGSGGRSRKGGREGAATRSTGVRGASAPRSLCQCTCGWPAFKVNLEMKRERPAHPRRPPKAGTRPSPRSPPPHPPHGTQSRFCPQLCAGGRHGVLAEKQLFADSQTGSQGAREPEPSAVLNPHPLPAIKCFDKRTPQADAARMQACLLDPSASPAWPPAGRTRRPPAGSGASGLKWQSNIPFTQGVQTHQIKVLQENASPQSSANSKPSQKGAQHQSKHPPETPSLSGCSETQAPNTFSNSYSQNKM